MRSRLRHQFSYDRLRFDRSRGALSFATTDAPDRFSFETAEPKTENG